jgi:DNA-binding Lrp family transcriptional regulator
MIDISNEAKKALEIIRQYGPIRSTELIKMLGISSKNSHKHLAKLMDERLIKKTGSVPRVFYVINNELENMSFNSLDKNDQLIEQNYIYVSPSGEVIRGISGFQVWCQKNQFNLEKEKKEFIQKLKVSHKFKNKQNGLISAKKIILFGKEKVYLDDIFFSDFYTIGHFGKTKLGQLVYLGKSSQNKDLILEIAKLTISGVKNIIERYNIGLVCFIPPTIDRKVQFLDVFEKYLNLDLPKITALKIDSPTKIPQKTLRKLEDRIINAQTTIAINPNQIIDSNILIIDDATGSGATLNETAKKIRTITDKKIKIIGYSVVGSFNGFDVISEV